MEGAIDTTASQPAPQLNGELVRLLDGSLRVEDFVATMVHEAAQPLTAIQVLVTALREQGDRLDAEERDRLLSDIEGQATFLRDLAGWMLDPFTRQTVDFDELVADVVEHCRSLAPNREIVTDFGAGGTRIDCEMIRVEASIRNLVKNAATHSTGSDPIVVSTAGDGEFAVVRVTNTGPTIPEEHWERIFQPYARVCEESEAPGTGLGLFVVNSCAKQHEGHARVASSDASGTTIELALRAVT